MRGTPYTFHDFRGGVVTSAQPYSLADNEARDARNVVGTVRGSIRKRNGSTSFATPASALTSLFADDVTATKYLIGAHTTKLVSIGTGGTVTDIKTGLTTGLKWSFIAAAASGGQGPVYGMNGTDTPQYWTGAAAGTATANWTASTGSVPNGTMCLYVGNRVFVSGVASNPSRLYFSNVGDPRDWPAANVVDFDPQDGDAITAIGTAGPYILVFKKTKTWLVTDLNTGANRPLSRGIGCVAPRSVVETPRGTFFLTLDQGIYRTNGTTLERVSSQITPTLLAIDQSARGNSAGVFHDDHYYLSIPFSSSTLDLTLDYDLTLNSWWFHTLAANQWVQWRPTADAELYAALPTAFVYKAFVSNQTQDASTNFTSYYRTRFWDFGRTHVNKRVREARFDGQGHIVLKLAKNFAPAYATVKDINFATSAETFGGTGTYGGSGTFGGDASIQQSEACTLGLGRSFSLEFGNVSADSFEIEGVTLAVMPPRKN